MSSLGRLSTAHRDWSVRREKGTDVPHVWLMARNGRNSILRADMCRTAKGSTE
jgi:hypothetical protein